MDNTVITEGAIEKAPVEQPIEQATAEGAGERAVNVDTVKVRAIKTFGAGADHRTPDHPPFEVSKQRAVELRINGLIEYVSAEDEDAAHAAAAKQASDAVAKRIANSPTLPSDAKSTPLKQHGARLKLQDENA